MTPAQRSTASAIVDRQMQAAGLAPVTSTATQGVSQMQEGIFGNPALSGGYSIPDEVSGVPMGSPGTYGTTSGFNSPTGMVDDFGNRPGTGTSSVTEVAGTNAPSSTTAGTGTVSGFGGVDDIGNRGTDTTSGGYTPGPSIEGMGKAEAAAQKAENKANAHGAAQAQTGNPNATAVTDSNGNAVTSGDVNSGTGGVVTGGTNEDNEKGGGQGGKIVCTEMYRQTQLDDWARTMKIWDIYQKKYLTPLHEIGYHWLFKPYVQGMRASRILTSLGAFLAQKRTEHLKYILTKGKSKDSLIGNIWCKIIHPIVYMVGKIVHKK